MIKIIENTLSFMSLNDWVSICYKGNCSCLYLSFAFKFPPQTSPGEMANNIVLKIPFTRLRFEIHNAESPQQSRHRRRPGQPRTPLDPNQPQLQPQPHAQQPQDQGNQNPSPVAQRPTNPTPTPTPIPDLPLSLDTLWFTSSPLILPPTLIRTGSAPTQANSSRSTSFSLSRPKTHVLILHVRFQDNSRTKMRLEWEDRDPSGTVKAQQRHHKGLKRLGRSQLEECRAR